ncbi:MAG: homoserine dehydrogenase [Chloroflexi bacterium]|nr:homoserine dehydrogenase [Chloroflexota bacterium]
MTVRLVLLGFGNVGSALARLILAKHSEVRQRYGLDLRVVAIATGRHGAAYDEAGLDLARALEIRGSTASLSELAQSQASSDITGLLEEIEAEAILESIPVNYQSGQPAIGYLETALRRGMHAITANKGPVVHGYQALSELAGAKGRQFLFEATVMDGTPLFSTWRECMPGAQLTSFRGVLNSTTNFLLSEMESGKSFDTALEEAQALGVAETDPSGDIDGWDAAIKVALVVTVLMDSPLGIQDVERGGIGELEANQIRAATQDGLRWRLVCSGWRENDKVRGRVRPERVGPEDPLYHVRGTSSLITFASDVLGDLTIMGADPGPNTTAYGMFADLLNAVRAS